MARSERSDQSELCLRSQVNWDVMEPNSSINGSSRRTTVASDRCSSKLRITDAHLTRVGDSSAVPAADSILAKKETVKPKQKLPFGLAQLNGGTSAPREAPVSEMGNYAGYVHQGDHDSTTDERDALSSSTEQSSE
jgi:hypothetical protein